MQEDFFFHAIVLISISYATIPEFFTDYICGSF